MIIELPKPTISINRIGEYPTTHTTSKVVPFIPVEAIDNSPLTLFEHYLRNNPIEQNVNDELF